MICYNYPVLTPDASRSAGFPRYPIKPDVSLLTKPFTAASSLVNMRFVKHVLRKRTCPRDNLTLFTMQHSQQAFSEMWNAPEEDIWDSL